MLLHNYQFLKKNNSRKTCFTMSHFIPAHIRIISRPIIVTRIQFCLFIDQFSWTFSLYSSVTCSLSSFPTTHLFLSTLIIITAAHHSVHHHHVFMFLPVHSQLSVDVCLCVHGYVYCTDTLLHILDYAAKFAAFTRERDWIFLCSPKTSVVLPSPAPSIMRP